MFKSNLCVTQLQGIFKVAIRFVRFSFREFGHDCGSMPLQLLCAPLYIDVPLYRLDLSSSGQTAPFCKTAHGVQSS